MADIRESRATLDTITTDRKDVARIMSSLADAAHRVVEAPFDERMERVNCVRAAIVNGFYRVRSADLALKLVDSMREGAGLRFCKEGSDPLIDSVSSKQETTHATFPPPAASESAEEVKHE